MPRLVGQTKSRGGINCAKDWMLPDKVHEIKKGEDIFWVDSGGRSLGYCGFCYDDLFSDNKEDIGL